MDVSLWGMKASKGSARFDAHWTWFATVIMCVCVWVCVNLDMCARALSTQRQSNKNAHRPVVHAGRKTSAKANKRWQRHSFGCARVCFGQSQTGNGSVDGDGGFSFFIEKNRKCNCGVCVVLLFIKVLLKVVLCI